MYYYDHDHGEKIHTCKPCGYWHVANGRFDSCVCPKCNTTIYAYSSRQWIIDNIDKRFEQIPNILNQSFLKNEKDKKNIICRYG